MVEDQKYPVCTDYFWDRRVSEALGTSVSFVIIAVNTVLKLSIIRLVQFIHEDTRSE